MDKKSKFQNKVHKVMDEYKRGTLEFAGDHKVQSREQAIAIAMSEARKATKK